MNTITEVELTEMVNNGKLKNTRCPRCRCYRTKTDFYNSGGRLLKTCCYCRKLCNNNQKKYTLLKKNNIIL